MPNEGHEREMAPEEGNRARPKMREQIVDLLARCCTSCTCTHSLSLRVPLPPLANTISMLYVLSADANNQLHSLVRQFFVVVVFLRGWHNRCRHLSASSAILSEEEYLSLGLNEDLQGFLFLFLNLIYSYIYCERKEQFCIGFY